MLSCCLCRFGADLVVEADLGISDYAALELQHVAGVADWLHENRIGKVQIFAENSRKPQGETKFVPFSWSIA